MLIATSSDSLTETPTTNWVYLAGTTTANTIKSSSGISLRLPTYLHNRQEIIEFNGKIHIACEGFTSASNPNSWRAHVARLETNGTWTLLGGDQGLRQSSSNTLDRRISSIYEFNGDLYASFGEGPKLKIARWNSGTSSWTHLTDTTLGLHYDSLWSDAWDTTPDWEQSATSFISISGSLFVVFKEATYSPSIRHALIAAEFNGSSFSRVDELAPTTPSSQMFNHEQTAELNEELFYYHRNLSATYLYRFDGTSFVQVNSATGADDNLLTGAGNSGHFYGDGSTLYSIYNDAGIRIRESIDGGDTFVTSASFANYVDSNSSGYSSYGDAFLESGQLFMTANESLSVSNAANQPFQALLLRRNGTALGDSWDRLGGGSFNTRMDKNVFRSQLKVLDGTPYVLFEQESFLIGSSPTRYPDNKIYLAKTTL